MERPARNDGSFFVLLSTGKNCAFISHRAHREKCDFKRFSSKLSAVSVAKLNMAKA
jgi:hypothetical protein